MNDEDLTFASTRPDNASRATLLNSAGLLPSAISRAVAVTTAWDMLMTGDVSAKDFVGCVNGVLRRETAEGVVEPFFRLAVLAAERWAPDALRRELLSSVADVCLALADHPERRRAALRTLARTAIGPNNSSSCGGPPPTTSTFAGEPSCAAPNSASTTRQRWRP